MTDKDYSKYQRDVIRRYYDNLNPIMLNRLQQLVSDLYLAEGEKKKARLWERVRKALVQLKTPSSVLDHIMEKRCVETLASNVEEWIKKS